MKTAHYAAKSVTVHAGEGTDKMINLSFSNFDEVAQARSMISVDMFADGFDSYPETYGSDGMRLQRFFNKAGAVRDVYHSEDSEFSELHSHRIEIIC